MKKLIWFLFIVSTSAWAQPRANTDEWSMHLFVIGPKDYSFNGGAVAKNDGGAGIGLAIARNLNNYFAIGLEASLSEFNYRATVTPGSGNAAAAYDTDGDMETGALRATVTWNLLNRPLTPFLTGNAGVIILDPSFDGNPPANACWNYAWYGEVCSGQTPSTALARFTYGVGAGLRYDLPRDQGFLRGLIGADWIDINKGQSPVGYLQLRVDFGLRF